MHGTNNTEIKEINVFKHTGLKQFTIQITQESETRCVEPPDRTRKKLKITTQTSAQDIIVRNLYYKAVKLISTVNKAGRERHIPKRFIVFDARVPLNLHRHLNIILFVGKIFTPGK